MKTLALCCTHGRHSCLERVVRCFLDQDYYGKHVLFIFNSGPELKLASLDLPSNKNIFIYNSLIDYPSVGAKFNHGLKVSLKLTEASIVTHFDDDDIFLPNHISEGVRGLKIASEKDMLAYKPKRSFYRTKEGINLVENNLEPSIFVDSTYLLEKGYNNTSITFHQHWLDPLIEENKIDIAQDGQPTLIYNWAGEVYKMSGSGDDGEENFKAHKTHSIDFGDSIVTPAESNKKYYDEIRDYLINKKD